MFIDSPLTSQAPYSLKGISYSQSMGRKDRHMSFIYLFEKLPSKNRWSNISAIGLCILISFFLYRYFLPQPRFSDQIFVFQQFLGNSFFSHLNIGNGRFAILGIKDLFFLPYLATGIEDATILMFALQTLYLLLFFIIFFYIAKKLSNIPIAILCITCVLLFGEQTDFYFIAEFGYASEISICTYLCAFIALYYKGKETNTTAYYIAASVIAIFIPYAKETYFIILFIFSFAKIILSYRKLDIKEKLFLVFIIISCIVYLVNYFIFAYTPSDNYADIHGATLLQTLKVVIKKCHFFIFAIIIFFVRTLQISKNSSHLCEADFLLLSSLAFISSYIVLQMPTLYYFVPGYVLFFLSLSQYIMKVSNHSHIPQNLISIFSIILLFPTAFAIFNARIPQFKMEREVSIPIGQFFANMELAGHPYTSFFPNEETLFDSILLQHVSGWKGTVIYVFKDYYVSVLKNTNSKSYLSENLDFNFATITTEEQKISSILFLREEEELKKYLDRGGIAVVPDSTNRKMFYQTDPNYKMLDFWWCKVAFNIKIIEDVKKYICPMLGQIQKNAGNNFFKNYSNFVYLMKQFDCSIVYPEGIAKNFKDLQRVNNALQAYKEKYHCYPKSKGFQGVTSQWGATKGDIWIDGLVPDFIDKLPQGNKKEFLYCSNGKDYKLLLHAPDNVELLFELYPTYRDPVRSTYALGFWTKNASSW